MSLTPEQQEIYDAQSDETKERLARELADPDTAGVLQCCSTDPDTGKTT